MELIRTFREKQLTKRQADIETQSRQFITLSDFAGDLYIAYNDVPLVLIEKNQTAQDIIAKLAELRQNYINSRLDEKGLPHIAAVL